MSYRRQATISFGPPMTRMVKQLIIVTSAVFVATYVLGSLPFEAAQLYLWAYPKAYLGLSPYYVIHPPFLIWQPVTYLFLHAGFWHIILNLLFLWMFGSDLERLWGSRQFLFYFFLTGVGAGVFDVLVDHNSKIPTVGNSGAVYGVLLAYGLLFPDRPIFLWFVIPIKAKWFVMMMALIELVSSWSEPGSGISHVAHLGGMLFGFLYLRGSRIPFQWQGRYQEWRRRRLRRKFELYMRDHEKGKDDAGRWIN
jgi:membrane associated rhomboid family serine protease